MKARHDFEIHPDVVALDKSLGRRIDYEKQKGAANLGIEILKYIPFVELDHNLGGKRFKLEMMVFGMDSWEQFERDLKKEVGLVKANILLRKLDAQSLINSKEIK